MNFYGQKEMTPVIYDETGVKLLKQSVLPAEALCFTIHWHDRLELIRVLTGGLRMIAGERSWPVHAGELAIINPRQLHGGIALEEGVTYRTIMFEIPAFYNGTSVTGRYLQPLAESRRVLVPRTDNPTVLKAMDALVALQDSGADALAVSAAVYQLLAELCAHCLEGGAELIGIGNDSRFRDVIGYINDHYREPVSSAGLSRRFGYDEAYFCRVFKSTAGMTAMRYIRLLRLEYARQRIQKEEAPVGEIALAAGFSDISYFTRCFRECYGMTPTALAALTAGK